MFIYLDTHWHTPKFFDGLNYEFKGEDDGMRRRWGALFGS